MGVFKVLGRRVLGNGRHVEEEFEIDTDDLGGGGESSPITPGIRSITAGLYGADNDDLVGGFVIGHLAWGEHVVQCISAVTVPFDSGPAYMAIGTPVGVDGPTVFTGGSLGLTEVTPMVPNAIGLVTIGTNFTAYETAADASPASVSIAPPDGIDIIATLDDGSGGNPGCTTGTVMVNLLIARSIL